VEQLGQYRQITEPLVCQYFIHVEASTDSPYCFSHDVCCLILFPLPPLAKYRSPIIVFTFESEQSADFILSSLL
jgi:hypothetical protein